jgi:hypothetical protein
MYSRRSSKILPSHLWSANSYFKHMEEHRLEWADNIKTDFKETGCEGVDWMHLTQDRG